MDQTHLENTKRVAKNTVFLYGRMLFGMLVSLYTSRLILNALGVEDYGINNVVGGFVGMFALISSALQSSISRFLTFEIGRGDNKKLEEVFSTSMLIQLLMCIVVFIAAETVGLWFVNYKMVIPHDRIFAANCIYQASIFSFMFGLIGTPYNAVLVAHEKMNIYAYFGILSIFLNLGIVLFIAYAPFNFDRLIMYSILLTCVGVIMQCVYWIYCSKHFSESRVSPRFYKPVWKEMSGFAGWNAIGCTAGILKDQGVNILLNLYFGPVVNAARGIAGSVSNAIGGFTGNFMGALNPQITKYYAAEDYNYTFSLVERGSRFGYYILLVFTIPIILETPYVLTLWLKHYPDFTVVFTRLVLCYSLLEVLSTTLITLQGANGNIRNYQLVVGGLLLMNFPLSWIVLKLGAAPYCVYFVAIAVGIGCLLTRLLFLRRMVGLSMGNYLRRVVGNVLVTTICAFVIPTVLYLLLEPGFIRLIIIILVGMSSGMLSALFVGCTNGERAFIIQKASASLSKFTHNH